MECDYKRSNKLWIGDLTGFHPIGFQALTKPLFIGSDLLTEQYVFLLVLIVSAYCIVTVTAAGCLLPVDLDWKQG